MSDKSTGSNNHFYGKKHTEESLKKISDASKGINNPNYNGKSITPDWIKKQVISNSKKPLLVIDVITGEQKIFLNSKECALSLETTPGNVRMCKNSYKLKKRYIIKDYIKEDTESSDIK